MSSVPEDLGERFELAVERATQRLSERLELATPSLDELPADELDRWLAIRPVHILIRKTVANLIRRGELPGNEHLRKLAAQWIEDLTPLPPVTKGWPRNFDNDHMRRISIRMAVAGITASGLLTRTRNETRDPVSACDAVVTAGRRLGIELTYAAVAKLTSPNSDHDAGEILPILLDQ